MIAVKEPAMNPQDFAAVVEVDQTTILRLAHKRDLPGTCGSSRWRFQGPDKQSWSTAPSFSPKGLGLTPYPRAEQAYLTETMNDMVDFLYPKSPTLYGLAAAKQMPAFKIGGSWRFSRQDIDSWIKQQSMNIVGKIAKSEDLR